MTDQQEDTAVRQGRVPGGSDQSTASAGDATPAQQLATLRDEVRLHLEAIKRVCLDVLGNEAADSEEANGPFVASIKAISEVCDRGDEFLKNEPDVKVPVDTSLPAGTCPAYQAFRQYVHDLKTTVSPVKYK